MRNYKALCVLLSALILACSSLDALAKEFTWEDYYAWEDYTEDGTEAFQQGRYEEAERLLSAALKAAEEFDPKKEPRREFGQLEPRIATSLYNLAGFYTTQGRYVEAEPLYQRALSIREQDLGPQHPYVAITLNNLGTLYYYQGRYAEAEPLYQRALVILEKILGPEFPTVAQSLNGLALLYHTEGHYAKAEPLYLRALAILKKAFGPEHPEVVNVQKNYKDLLRMMGRKTD